MLRVTSYDWGHEYGCSEELSNRWISKSANSAGGVSIRFSVKNYGKPVKKHTVYFKAYDGADELVTCEASRKTVCGAKSADYLGTDSYRRDIIVENAWYSHAIRRIEIDSIEVTYSDGTTETCRGNYTPTAEEQSKEYEENKNGCITIFAFGVLFFTGSGLVMSDTDNVVGLMVGLVMMIASVVVLIKHP